MKKPLNRKLIVKEQLKKGAGPCEIQRVLEEKGIYISRMTLWRDTLEVQKYSEKELIYNHEMNEIERRKSLRERQKKAVQAKNSLRLVNPPSVPDKSKEKPVKRVPEPGADRYQVMKGKELEDFFKDSSDGYRSPF